LGQRSASVDQVLRNSVKCSHHRRSIQRCASSRVCTLPSATKKAPCFCRIPPNVKSSHCIGSSETIQFSAGCLGSNKIMLPLIIALGGESIAHISSFNFAMLQTECANYDLCHYSTYRTCTIRVLHRSDLFTQQSTKLHRNTAYASLRLSVSDNSMFQ
jgi:hypothetical protein